MRAVLLVTTVTALAIACGTCPADDGNGPILTAARSNEADRDDGDASAEQTGAAPPPADLYRPAVRVEADPPGFYAATYYRERGLPHTAGGFDADARGWIKPFRRYVASGPLRPTQFRHTLYLIPLGPLDERVRKRMDLVREFLEAYLTLPVRMEPAAGLEGCPSRPARVAGRTVRQYEAEHLIDHLLKPQRPADALAVVGLASQDLYGKQVDWASVAHLARTGEGLAVCSLARTFPEFFERRPDPEKVYRNRRLAFGIAADAACRTIGLTPCRKYYCVMNQARRSSTTEPLHLCPDCLRKLRWTLGFDPVERYETLRRFYKRVGLPVQATWVQRRLVECRKAKEAAEADTRDTE